MMKHLFRQFVKDIRKQADESAQIVDKEVDLTSQEVKIPAIQLFDELGKLFDKELKHMVSNSQRQKKRQRHAAMKKAQDGELSGRIE